MNESKMTAIGSYRDHNLINWLQRNFDVKFLWLKHQLTQPSVGPALTYTRTGAMFEPQPDGTFRLLAANILGPNHYLNGAFTELEWYAATPASWTKTVAGDTIAAQAGISPTGRVWQRFTGDGTNAVHSFNDVATIAATAAEKYSGRLVIADVSQRYVILGIYGGTNTEWYQLRIDLTSKTAVSGSDGAHTTTFTATVKAYADHLEIDYIFTVPTTETIKVPVVILSDASWNITTTPAGAVDISALSCVKSNFALAIGDSAGASYAIGNSDLYCTFPNIQTGCGFFVAVTKRNHAGSTGAYDRYGGLTKWVTDGDYRNEFCKNTGGDNQQAHSTYGVGTYRVLADIPDAAISAGDKALGGTLINVATLWAFGKTNFLIHKYSGGGTYIGADSQDATMPAAVGLITLRIGGLYDGIRDELWGHMVSFLYCNTPSVISQAEGQQIVNALLRIS